MGRYLNRHHVGIKIAGKRFDGVGVENIYIILYVNEMKNVCVRLYGTRITVYIGTVSQF